MEETPLAHACAKGFLDIVELLVLYGADLNYLCSVCSYTDFGTLEILKGL